MKTAYMTGNWLLALAICVNAGVVNAQEELTYEQKFEVVDKVYQRIYNAMGLREDRPQLILDQQRTRSVAYLKKNRDGGKSLAVETKAFDICMSFGQQGEAALALLIGHELGHFRYNHHWGKDFASSFAMADIEEANTKLSELKFYETQADQAGGIYCYLAGYDIGGLTEALFSKIYKEYGLPNEIPKYPSLNQRIAIANKNDSTIKQVIRVFETGTYALMVGQYDEARHCFDFAINNGFKSREVYNNAGVACLLSAMEKIGKDKVKYAYPLEIDVEARIKATTKGFSKEIDAIIKRAKELFTLSSGLDPEYVTAVINIACAHSLLNELEEAELMAAKARKLAESLKDINAEVNASVVSGIVADQKGNTGDAKKILTQAMEKNGSYLAGANLAILQGKSISELKWAKKMARESLNQRLEDDDVSGSPAVESIDGVSSFQEEMQDREMNEITMNDGSCFYMEMEQSIVYNLTTGSERELFFHKTGSEYQEPSGRGVKRGMDSKLLFKTYGFPDVVFNARNQTIMVYKSSNIIFLVDNGKVKGWIHYGIV